MSYRLTQVSDCHLLADQGAMPKNRNPDQGLQAILPFCTVTDLLVASGDLSDDGSEMSYRRLAEYFESTGKEVLAFAGNHDNKANMKQFLVGNHIKLQNQYVLGRWLVHVVDTVIGDQGSGRVSDEELQVLEAVLQANEDKHMAIFMHHQAVVVGSAWIDKYGIGNSDMLLSVLRGKENIRFVAHGHVHHALEQTVEGVRIFACPATAYQMKAVSDEKSLLPFAPAVRHFELEDDGRFKTWVETAFQPKN